MQHSFLAFLRIFNKASSFYIVQNFYSWIRPLLASTPDVISIVSNLHNQLWPNYNDVLFWEIEGAESKPCRTDKAANHELCKRPIPCALGEQHRKSSHRIYLNKQEQVSIHHHCIWCCNGVLCVNCSLSITRCQFAKLIHTGCLLLIVLQQLSELFIMQQESRIKLCCNVQSSSHFTQEFQRFPFSYKRW